MNDRIIKYFINNELIKKFRQTILKVQEKKISNRNFDIFLME